MSGDLALFLIGAAAGTPLAIHRLRRTLPQIRAGARPLPRHRTILGRRRPPRQLVYLVQQGDTGPIKIGTTTDLPRRLHALQTGSPLPLHVRLLLEGGTDLEGALHARFAGGRLAGEWFAPSPDLLDFIHHP